PFCRLRRNGIANFGGAEANRLLHAALYRGRVFLFSGHEGPGIRQVYSEITSSDNDERKLKQAKSGKATNGWSRSALFVFIDSCLVFRSFYIGKRVSSGV